MLDTLLLCILLYSDYNKHSKWKVFVLKIVVKQNMCYHGNQYFNNLNNEMKNDEVNADVWIGGAWHIQSKSRSTCCVYGPKWDFPIIIGS